MKSTRLNLTDIEVSPKSCHAISFEYKAITHVGEVKRIIILLFALAGETYKYHWTLDQTPEGDNIGQTSGIDEPTIHLTEVPI